MIVPLGGAGDASTFGGKASGLARAIGAGLPVPPGLAFDPDGAAALARGEVDAALARALDALGVVAVRSSALGEDGDAASFAGVHATVLGCSGAAAVAAAAARVVASATTKAALAYREKLGVSATPRMAVVVQRLVDADASAIVFSRDPVDGSDRIVIEAAWGLGEILVQGLVNPDRVHLSRDGRVLFAEEGDKDLEIIRVGAATEERRVEGDRRHRRVLGDEALAAIARLVPVAESLVGGPVDLELAWERGEVFLLQQRRITR